MENPLKLYGSWIGAYIFPALMMLATTFALCGFYDCKPMSSWLFTALTWFTVLFDGWSGFLVGLGLSKIGFILGWAIHAGIKEKFKSKNMQGTPQ